MYCKHCEDYVGPDETEHNCRKIGLLNVDEDDSFLVSSLIGYATNSTIVGGLLGGSFLGGGLGDGLNGGFTDDDGDWD